MKSIRQHDQNDCGAACLAAVAAHYGRRIPLAQIRLLAGTDRLGSSLAGLCDAARRMGFQAEGAAGPYEGLLQASLPAIVHFRHADTGEHFVVLYRVSKRWARVMDPADGRRRRLPKALFCQYWSGAVLFLLPGPAFGADGQPASLPRQFAQLLYPHRRVLAGAVAAALGWTLLAVGSTLLVQLLADRVLPARNGGLLHQLGWLFSGLLLCQAIAGTVKNLLTLSTGRALDTHLLSSCFRHLLQLPQSFFDGMRNGEIRSRLSDVLKIRYFINDVLVHLSIPAGILLFTLLFMLIRQAQLALILLLMLPLYLLVYALSNRLNRRVQRRLMEQDAALDSQLTESLRAIGTVKQLGLETLHARQAEALVMQLAATSQLSGRNTLFTEEATAFLSRTLTLALLWGGGTLVLQGGLSLGELLSFYALSDYFSAAVAQLIPMNKSFQDARIAAGRLFDILALPPDEKPGATLLHPDNVQDICFENVSFGYRPRHPILQQLNLHIRAGQITAITGSSGSGKSTLFSLLLKQYPVSSGLIRLGVYALPLISRESLNKLIAAVPQQTELFNGSLAQNICPGEPRPDTARLAAICQRLGLMPFIDTLEAGFDTPVGEDGRLLSGGQRQRLALARAIYRQPQVLLLDEATAALDADAEQHVHDTLLQLKAQGTTILLITHRPGSLQLADQVIHLVQGRIRLQQQTVHHTALPPIPAAGTDGALGTPAGERSPNRKENTHV